MRIKHAAMVTIAALASGTLLINTAIGADPKTKRISVRSNEGQALGGPSLLPEISADGRFVAFQSDADDLVPNDNNEASDIFVRDRKKGITRRVSVATNGDEGELGGASYEPQMSADGRFIAFVSTADELVPGDDNGLQDVFLRDRQQGTTKRMNLTSDEAQTETEPSFGATVSDDGRIVAFASGDGGLVPGDDNELSDIFVRNRTTGMTSRVSVSSTGEQSLGDSFGPSLSSTGRIVGFSSSGVLVPEDDNALYDVYIHDRKTSMTKRVSVRSNEGQALEGDSTDPELSANGRIIAFESHATNLVPNDENFSEDIFVRDRDAGTTERVSVTSAGQERDGSSEDTGLTSNGRYIVFESRAPLVGSDTNDEEDSYLHDRSTNKTRLISLRNNGEVSPQGLSDNPKVSSGARFVVFNSEATDLVPNDTNGVADIFLRGPLN